jgi:hypothetical protein
MDGSGEETVLDHKLKRDFLQSSNPFQTFNQDVSMRTCQQLGTVYREYLVMFRLMLCKA